MILSDLKIYMVELYRNSTVNGLAMSSAKYKLDIDLKSTSRVIGIF